MIRATLIGLCVAAVGAKECSSPDIDPATLASISNNDIAGCSANGATDGGIYIDEALMQYNYTCDDGDEIKQELIDEGVMTAADAESWPDLSSTLWTFCCQTCQAVAEAATPTVPPAKIDDCTSTLVEPCIASLDTPPRTSKACMAAALSGSDACSADNSDCFRTLYDYCQNLDPIE